LLTKSTGLLLVELGRLRAEQVVGDAEVLYRLEIGLRLVAQFADALARAVRANACSRRAFPRLRWRCTAAA